MIDPKTATREQVLAYITGQRATALLALHALAPLAVPDQYPEAIEALAAIHEFIEMAEPHLADAPRT